VFHSFSEAEPFRSAWNELVLRSGADIYQTYDWCRIWWQHYGDRRQLHLLLCFSGEELVGVIPAFIENLGLGLARVRVSKLVGSDYTLNLCNLPILPDSLPMVVSRAIHHFLGEHHCDLFLLGPLSGPAARVAELITVGQNEHECVAKVESLGDSCNTYIKLPSTFDEYLKAIGKQQRGNLNRTISQFSKAHKVVFDVVTAPEKMAAEFEGFCRLHNAQWRAEGKLGHFGDWPEAENFNRELIRALGGQGMVRFHRILANDQVVSCQYNFVFGNTNYWRLPARVFAPEWDRLSFGRMGLAKMIEASIAEGQHTIEGGRGHYAYKLQMGGREWPLRTIQFMRHGPGVSARVRMFKAFATLLNIFYYKVLFCRLAPRFPALRRPLWRIWIRSTW
jgi:CelD/BcsL family acetyltransferase involved in cellulose biosynthesis